jgi:hypothetical protein
MKRPWVWVVLVLCLVARLWFTTQSKHGDMYNNLDWGEGAAVHGLSVFYDLPKEDWNHSRPNQPPGSIYLHLVSYWLNQWGSRTIAWANDSIPVFPSKLVWWWEIYGNLVTIKLPSIVGDFAIFGAIVTMARRWGKEDLGLKVGLVYLLNPALWYNSSWWGQTDSVVAAYMLWSIVFLFTKQPWKASFFAGLSLITKASWAPIVPLIAIYWWRNHYKLAPVLGAALAVLLVAIPFHPHLDVVTWLINLYTTRILPGESGFITVSAFNFWHFLVGQKLVPDRNFTLMANLLVGMLGLVGMVIVGRRPNPQGFLRAATILFFGVFLFASRMHERYLYPIFPLMSLGIVTGFSWALPYALASVTYIINLYYQWWSPGWPWVIQIYTETFTRVVSMINMGLLAVVALKSKYAKNS